MLVVKVTFATGAVFSTASVTGQSNLSVKMYPRPSPSELIHQEQTKEARDRFNHVVIDLKAQLSKSGDAALVASTVIPEAEAQKVPQQPQGRRRSSLQWITGKVEQLRKKFTPSESNEQIVPVKKATTTKTTTVSSATPLSPSDALFLKICQKYKRCAENKYCVLDFAFDDVITQFSALLEDIELADDRDELPRGALLFPLSDSTGLCILDFEQVGGYSLGRGSKIVSRGKESISRSHCLIYSDRDGLAVKDCDSHTGTFVCGRLIGSGIPVALQNFDIIQMGYSQRGPQDTVQFLIVFLRNWNARKFGDQMQSVASPISLVQSPTLSSSMLDVSQKKFTASFAEEKEPQLMPPQIESNVKRVPVAMQETPTKRVSTPLQDPLQDSPTVQKSFTSTPTNLASMLSTPMNQEQEPIARQSTPITHDSPLPSHYSSIQSSPMQSSPIQNSPIENSALQYSIKSNHNSPAPSPLKTAPVQQANSAKSSPTDGSQVQYSPIKSPWSVKTQEMAFEPSQLNSSIASATSSPTLTEICAKQPNLSEKTSATEAVPPMRPKPRVVKRNLTKSIEDLNASTPIVSQFTVKNPIEIPEILKAANVSEIPVLSPVTEWLLSAPIAAKCSHSLSIPLMEKRPARLQKMKKLAEFSTLPVGPNTIRFENFLDFGLFSSDISDGAARTWRGSAKEAMKWAFHNYRNVWEVEGVDLASGTKIVFTARDQNRFNVSIAGGSCEEAVPIGQFGVDVKKRMMAKMVFNLLNDSTFSKLSGRETSSTLKALRQLSYFYPHLKTPAVVISGAPSGPESSVRLSLEGPEDGESKSIGRVRFEGHRMTWTKHSMSWATDLDSAALEAESLMTDFVHGAVLLYCLRYHLD